MPEEKITAETTVYTEGDGHADAADDAEKINGADFVDGSADFAPEELRSKRQNSENARRRREAERRAEIERVRKEARDSAIIEALSGINPYTDEPMKDGTDVKEFLLMREIEQSGGDPLSDFSRFHKQKEREKEKEAEKLRREDEWYREDREKFLSKHPEVNLEQLINDESFKTFAKGRAGNAPLSDIYEDFTSFTSDYEKRAMNIAAQRVANGFASPGSLSHAAVEGGGLFTRDEVARMSVEEIEKNYDKVRSSMTKWKN